MTFYVTHVFGFVVAVGALVPAAVPGSVFKYFSVVFTVKALRRVVKSFDAGVGFEVALFANITRDINIHMIFFFNAVTVINVLFQKYG